MLARLEHAFAGQREFLDDAGHELRTPLTILRGHLELLDGDDPAELDRTRELLLDEVDRMSRLVDDLIMLTKADRPDFFTFADVDVGGLVDRVAEKVRPLGDRDWRIDARADVSACLDEQRLTQALVQLAQNAVKHTRPGDTVALGADVAPAGRSVRLWVRDTGPGVPDAQKAAIFARFARGEKEQPYDAGDAAHGGFGLGLSIVSAIAAGHGGSVWVEDAGVDGRPRGARFVVEVPTRRSPVSASWPAS
jgi:signal transduction histidine kinase